MENCKQYKLKFKCPVCSNFMKMFLHNSSISGQCPVCKAVICSKQISSKEKLLKIKKA
ncbi:MAG: hypothetical protein IJ837_03410 [Clostridia bacterium]|nr:hypothetical protein [Clostridia bacterium]